MVAKPFAVRLALLCALALPAFAQRYHVYIQDLGANYVQIGWGTTAGNNTIGRSAPSPGTATVRIDNRTLTTSQNSIVVPNLSPDHEYSYEIDIDGRRAGGSVVRTWPAQSNRLVFFVIGDYGTGNSVQYGIARVMAEEFDRRAKTADPVRFVISTGDNIYGNFAGFLFGVGHTGASDADWAGKFFNPYESIIARVPWFPSLGNHDGNETEARGDLPQYLDNMPFPGGKPARFYHFNYAGLADFFGLDSTRNTESGGSRPMYLPDSAEFHWMQQEFPKAHAPWVIPYFHHPLFNAGPLHAPNYRELAHWVPLFRAAHVRVVFNGHEHNFQMSEVNSTTSGIRYFTSGAGGELRPGNVESHMRKANIAAWCGENHFLVVEIDGRTMHVTPIGAAPLNIVDPDGKELTPPFTVTAP